MASYDKLNPNQRHLAERIFRHLSMNNTWRCHCTWEIQPFNEDWKAESEAETYAE
jgi:hypothetical protein